MDKLISMLDDENVDVATPQVNSRNEYNKLDKEKVKLQLQTRKDLEEIQTELLGKTFDERFDWIVAKKEAANKLFTANNFQEAQKIYLKALMGITDKDLTAEQTAKLNQIKFSILCNMAIAAAEMCSNKKSISLLNQAAKINDTDKLNYLFATNYFKLQEYDIAVKYINKAYEMVQKSENKEKIQFYKETRNKILTRSREHYEKEKAMYSKIFESQSTSAEGLQSDSFQEAQKTVKLAPSICQRIRGWIRDRWSNRKKLA